MIFLTNKSVSDFENVDCIFSGIPFSDVKGINLSQGVVVDINPQRASQNVWNIVRMHSCRYLEAPVEKTKGNIIYIVQDGEQQIIKLEVQR